MSLYQKVAYITPDDAVDVPASADAGGALGAGLFTSARAFTYNTYAGGPATFALDRQGLVALMASDSQSPYGVYNDGGFRIVTEADGTMAPLTFFEAISALCSYGTADEGLSHDQLLTLAKTRPLEMRCGPTTAFVRQCAAGLGLSTRQVHTLNVTANNGFDDGHVALEALVAGKWTLFDVPNDIAWADGSGALMSLAEVVALRPMQSTPVVLAQPRVGRAVSPSNTVWLAALYEMTFRTPAASREWCERIYEVPGMATPTGICWGVPDHLSGYAAQIANYPGTGGTWTTLPWAQWLAAYY